MGKKNHIIVPSTGDLHCIKNRYCYFIPSFKLPIIKKVKKKKKKLLLEFHKFHFQNITLNPLKAKSQKYEVTDSLS